MSRLNAPPPDPARTRGKREPIIKNRKKRPLHPYTIRDLLYARSQEDHVTQIHAGWLLIFWEADGVKHYLDVNYIKNPDGSRRPATYEDVVAVREAEMRDYGYEKCWLIMKSAEDDGR